MPEVRLNVAVTEVLAARATTHALVPLQPPDQPANVDPVPAVSVSVTDVPVAMLALHVVPQLIPEGLLVTVPVPVPASCTVSGEVGTLNVAVTEVAAVRVTAQVLVPLQAPDQPAKVEPVLGAAVSVTDVPKPKVALHVVPQLMPVGLLVTVPVPVPAFCTVS